MLQLRQFCNFLQLEYWPDWPWTVLKAPRLMKLSKDAARLQPLHAPYVNFLTVLTNYQPR